MNQQYLFEPIPDDKYATLTREELITLHKGELDVNRQLQSIIKNLKFQIGFQKQQSLSIDEINVILKNKIFGKSSEKSPKEEREKKELQKRKKKIQLPSARYPNAALVEQDVVFENPPNCSCCGNRMSDSGMTEDSEHLTVIPAKFYVIRQKRHKYRCGKCHGHIQLPPLPKRINPGGTYSDEMIIDSSLSKYCDLIPIERYVSMAGRNGLTNLPQNSLIDQSHKLADFVYPAFEIAKKEVTSEKVIKGDETPHRMLEGDKKSRWYLWGFSSTKACVFDARNTRSGEIASEFLKKTNCEFLVSDVFSGYGRAIKESNSYREKHRLPLIKNAYCNAHSRRKFVEAKKNNYEEADFFIENYRKIFHLESLCKEHPPDKKRELRKKALPIFEKMREKSEEMKINFSSKSYMGRAIRYFQKNYDGLTLYLDHPEVPAHNNDQERALRNPVIGRKTWYGTHSKKGARTAAILFSLVESCKLNKINPRNYFKDLVKAIHENKPPFSPYQYSKS